MKIAISSHGPKCPNCGCDGFDDWWHEKTIRRGFYPVDLEGSLRCHGCGRFFSVRLFHDVLGCECHCVMKTKPKPAAAPLAA